ncbi:MULTISPECIES: NAD(P)H-dependent oxidoreductase [unclassified Tatumella]|uniref:NAD(P)H-dependent oxidoreductase n=1 Tax=unclassified Tatumella TaxID=2649542 RepID=UPI001BB041E1|nr:MULTISPECIES: NAD(P)H-dependent oxidoreductase [unclassified Tatumella]MBS0877849.1 NAD(P)H-dependent oxidoreductase [Tatumella sp. JGM82]MBS0891554.1 NAD(P)H-dependent oxidoreductase [Tatumella sp. JGM94]MBS0902484.1 NAD(P)H-dependent oxidoreductase [Tatumella sp. JGM100]
MSNILIIDGGTTFGHSAGRLNHTLSEQGAAELRRLGHEVSVTRVDQPYDIEAEIEKFVRNDVVILQMPGWWMGEPWTVKKYIDEVFTYGHGRLYASDGRTRADSEKKYGSGGLLQGKKYMLSLTWNAPLQAFTDPQQFFEGSGVDGVYLHTHKAFQFLGMSGLPTFICNDVIKDPQVPLYIENYQQHLQQIFG